ncbi:DUF2283 domain-containing protein [bacterium]|nr:DUF2283 domain-containing protein [bacterium]
MRITYDPKTDAAYIYLEDKIGPSGVARTYPCDPKGVNGQINLDFDSEGRLLGIEILDARRKLPEDLLRSAPLK